MDRSLTRQHRRARELVAYHLELFGACLNPALPKYRDPELEARRLSLDGLGPPAAHLRELCEEVCTPSAQKTNANTGQSCVSGVADPRLTPSPDG